jgi:hypothetical protein
MATHPPNTELSGVTNPTDRDLRFRDETAFEIDDFELTGGDDSSDSSVDLSDSFLLDKPTNPYAIPGHSDPILDKPNKVWTIRHNLLGERGPLKGFELRSMIDAGELPPDALVCRDDWEDWLRAKEVFPETINVSENLKSAQTGDRMISRHLTHRGLGGIVVGIVAIVLGLATIIGLIIWLARLVTN